MPHAGDGTDYTTVQDIRDELGLSSSSSSEAGSDGDDGSSSMESGSQASDTLTEAWQDLCVAEPSTLPRQAEAPPAAVTPRHSAAERRSRQASCLPPLMLA